MNQQDVTLHMIGNAHLDPVWLWQWPEGLQEGKATFRSALDRLRDFPGFIFTSSSAAIYEWVEENDPEIFEEIQQRVAEGRWQIAGGWWIQPDCNVPGGESYVRQGLYGQHYFREKFGVTASVGYNVDSFGHNGMLPQILRKSGMDSYVFMRPEPAEMDLPGRIFWWESDDGSRVLTFRIPYAYTVGTTIESLETQVQRNAAEATPAFPEVMCFYGVGNHGGGPTVANLRWIEEKQEDETFPELIYSHPRAFLDRVQGAGLDLPVVHDDLQHHASGCYAAHAGVKRWNRQAENLLLAAEKWSAVAAQVLGRRYPLDEFTSAWKQVLFNQFHDTLAGTSIEPAYDDARDTYGEAMAVARRRLLQSIQALAWQIDVPFEENVTPIVVFNPHAWPVTAGVELEFGRLGESDRLIDDEGRDVPLQVVQSQASVSGGRNRLCFLAEVPALGYRTFRVGPRDRGRNADVRGLKSGDDYLENDRVRLEVDPSSGAVTGLWEKRLGQNLVRGAAAKPVVIDDRSDTWSHGVLRFDQVVGEFAATSVQLVERGPVRAVLRVRSAYASSTLVQDFVLYAGLGTVEVRVTVDWREQFKMLKLLFPISLSGRVTTYEIPYGVIERPENGEEEPGQAWIDVSGSTESGAAAGLSVLNDGKYSFHSEGGTVGLTVLRSPIYAHHDPYVPQDDREYRFMDQGVQRFTYTLVPHTGEWRTGEAVRRATELNQPMVAMFDTCHAGKIPQSGSFLAVEQSNIVVSVVKLAEDGEDFIVRAYETAGRVTQARLHLQAWGRTEDFKFSPFEIKSLRVPRDASRPIRETNLIEWY